MDCLARTAGLLAALCALTLAGCGDDGDDLKSVGARGGSTPPEVTSPDETPPPSPSPPAAGTPAPPSTTTTGTFTDVHVIFQGACAFGSCHGSRNPRGGLDLATDPYAAIVGVPSPFASDYQYVVPGEPENSYLYLKLTEETPPFGEAMPPPSMGGAKLSDERLETVRSWIAAGAMND